MRNPLTNFVCVVWALWFGGIATLFVVMGRLFAQAPDVARPAAAPIFHIFEKYQLVLATAALVATLAWRLCQKSALLTSIFCLFGVAALNAVVETSILVPRMDRLRANGLSNSQEFLNLHGRSMMLYTAQLAALLIAGLLLPGAIRGKEKNS